MTARTLFNGLALTFNLLAVDFAAHAASVQAAPIQSVSAAQFVDGIGVNIHAMYMDGGYANLDQIVRAMRYLGIVHARDAALAEGPTTKARYDRLARAGLRFDFMVQKDIPGAVARMHDFEARHPGAIALIEGPNEVNNSPISYGGFGGRKGAQAFQAALYQAAKADPLLRAIPVVNFTGYSDTPGQADFAVNHGYPHRGEQPYTTIANQAAKQARVMPGKPFLLTESGYYSLPGRVGWGGVDEATQARLIVNLLFDAASIGVRRTYIYQLLDAYPDPGRTKQESHFGLFDIKYRPKPAATAIRNLTTLLSQSSTAAAPANGSPVRLDNLPDHVRSLIIHAGKADFIALWNEDAVWDNHSARALTAMPKLVHVQLAAPDATVELHTPLQASPSQRLKAENGEFAIKLGADAVLLEIASKS